MKGTQKKQASRPHPADREHSAPRGGRRAHEASWPPPSRWPGGSHSDGIVGGIAAMGGEWAGAR